MSQLLAPGTYTATVTQSVIGKTRNGDPQLAVGLEIDVPGGQTVSRTWYGFFTEKAEPTTVKALRTLGFDVYQRQITDLSPPNPFDSPLAGVRCRVEIEHEMWEPDDGSGPITRDRIRWINDLTPPLAVKERMEGADLADFANRFRARVLSTGGQQAMSRPPASGGSRPAAPAGRGAPPAGRPTSGPPAQPHGRPPAARGPAPAQGQQQGQPDLDDIPF